jgi:oligopeptide transport system substrate-binding protein
VTSHRPALAALFALITLVLFDCGKQSGSPAPAASAHEPVILLRGNGPEPDSLDPQKARSNEAQQILRDLYECLTSIGKDGGVAPGVATSWEVTANGLGYTFHLRPDARWSNGDPVLAGDFVAGMRRLVDPATASQYAQIVDVILNANDIITGRSPPNSLGVSAPDDRTVVIDLSAPTPYLPSLLAHSSTCPIHRPTLASAGNAFSKPGTMVSNGAFVLKEWVQGSHVLLERNTHYWNNAATKLDGVKYLPIGDENAELTRYRADQLHVTATVPRSQLDWIKSHIGGELHIAPQISTYFYGFNLDREPFKSHRELRQALSMVIDRERLAESVLRAGELPAYGWIPPGMHDYSSQSFNYRAWPMAQRISAARKLYAQAGYSASKPLSFELRYNTGEINNKLAVAIASMWKEALGVNAKLVAVEFKSLLQDVDQRNVDVFRSSWIGDYNDAYTFAQYLKGDFGINLPHYRSAEYDELVGKAAAQSDAVQRRALLEQAERVMLNDHPIIPLYFYVNKHLVKPQVQGWYDNVMNVVYSKDLSLFCGIPTAPRCPSK